MQSDVAMSPRKERPFNLRQVAQQQLAQQQNEETEEVKRRLAVLQRELQDSRAQTLGDELLFFSTLTEWCFHFTFLLALSQPLLGKTTSQLIQPPTIKSYSTLSD